VSSLTRARGLTQVQQLRQMQELRQTVKQRQLGFKMLQVILFALSPEQQGSAKAFMQELHQDLELLPFWVTRLLLNILLLLRRRGSDLIFR